MPGKAVFMAARVANAETNAWLPDHAVIVEDGRIAAVASQRQLPTDVAGTHALHDFGAAGLLPGLIETHVHLHFPAHPDYQEISRPEPVERLCIRATGHLRTLLLSGATTARDTGSRNDVAFALRAALRDRVAPGPRLLVAGAPITTTGGHYWFLGAEADTTDEVVKQIRALKKLGADCIKVMCSGGGYTYPPSSNPRAQQYPLETMRTAVREAARLGLPVLAHSLTAAGNRICVEAGVHTIIHGGVWWTEYPVMDRAYAYDLELADQMARQGVWVDPTLGELQLHQEWHDAGRPAKREFGHWALPHVPSDVATRLGFARDMHQRGVRFIGGMGMGMPIVTFDAVACSAQVYVSRLGFPPWEAIRSITSQAAEALGLGRELGAIRPGLAADLVAVDGDPAADINALRRVTDVVQAGVPVKLGGKALV